MMWPKSVLSTEPNIPPERYSEAAEEAFELLERLATEVLPLLWARDTTFLQLQISTLVFTQQMSGHYLTTSDLAAELNYPRSSVQNALDKLIDQGKLETRQDPADGRKRLVAVPRSMAQWFGDAEELALRLLFFCHSRVEAVLGADDTMPDRIAAP